MSDDNITGDEAAEELDEDSRRLLEALRHFNREVEDD